MTTRNFTQNPGMDGSFVVQPFQSSANWITTGALITALRGGTPSVNTFGNFSVPWYPASGTDPLVTVTDGTKSFQVHVPLGATVEGPASVYDQSIGGADASKPYLVWSISGASINTGAVAASGSVITGTYGLQIDDGSGLMMVDAVTGQPGTNNSYGNIQSFELAQIAANSAYVVPHMLTFQLDSNTQASLSGPIWPLAVLDTSNGTYAGPIPQGITIGIPASTTRPTGQTRGFYALWDQAQQFGLFNYNFGATGGTNIMICDTSGAYSSLVADMVTAWPTVMQSMCILNYANGVSGAQYSLATTKGAVPGSTNAYPAPPPLDLSPTGGLNVMPSSFLAWYPSGYNAVPTNSTTPPIGNVSNLINGLVAWAPNQGVLMGARVANGGSAYQCVLAGTTASSGGPTGSSGNILDGTARWAWLSTVDFSSLSAAVGNLPTTFMANLTFEIWNAASQTTSAATPFMNLSGHTMGAYGLTLTAPPSDSIRTALSSQTLPLNSNTNAGSAFLQPLANAAGINYTVINDPSVTLNGLQFIDPAAASGSTILDVYTSNTTFVCRNCIFDGYAQTGGASIIEIDSSGTVLFANCLFIDRQPAAGTAPPFYLTAAATYVFVNCTFVSTNSATGIGPLLNSGTGTGIVRNCAFFGYGALGFVGFTIDHCATSASGWGSGTVGSGNITSATASASFMNTANDFRLLGSSPLLYAGTPDLTDIPTGDDIAGTPRKQGPSWSIGCWERQSFGPAEIRTPPIKFW